MKKIMLISLLTLILLLHACTHKGESQSGQTTTMTSLSLRQAIELAYEEAMTWNKDAKLMDATSVRNEKGNDKVDGKSRAWEVTFGIPGNYDAFWVHIRDGKVDHSSDISDEDVMPLLGTAYIADLDKIKFDSPELLKKAIKTNNLYPSDNEAEAYTYKLSKNAEADIILLQIIGWDEKEERVKGLKYDAHTGELYQAPEAD